LPGYRFLLHHGFRTSRKVFRLEHLTNFGLALPTWPIFFVEFHEADCRLDCLLFRLQFKLGVAADNLFGLGKRPVSYGYVSSRKPNASTLRGWPQASISEHGSGFDFLLHQACNRVHQFFGWRALLLGMLDYHHELHCPISLFRVGSWAV